MTISTILENYLSKNNKTDIIFDFDNTIVKLNLPWNKWLVPIKDQISNFDSSILKQYQNQELSLSELMNKYVMKFGEPVKKIFIANCRKFEKNLLNDYVVNKDIISFIKKESKYTYHIWSSNSKKTIVTILSTLKIENRFENLVSFENVFFLKPDPEGFYKIYETSREKSAYLFVGDTNSDEIASIKAGVNFIRC